MAREVTNLTRRKHAANRREGLSDVSDLCCRRLFLELRELYESYAKLLVGLKEQKDQAKMRQKYNRKMVHIWLNIDHGWIHEMSSQLYI